MFSRSPYPFLTRRQRLWSLNAAMTTLAPRRRRVNWLAVVVVEAVAIAALVLGGIW